jgi:hypothetical protein
MEHTSGQIAEYGTKEFNDNQSIYSVIERGLYINPYGMKFPTEFYHRTEGYKIAGSCAIWTSEVWGYKIFWNDGSTTGRFYHNEEIAIEVWNKLVGNNV